MGRILGLDFGLRRVGAALSDPGRTIASPLEVYERKGVDQDARHYRNLTRENDVEQIVIGLPVHTTGREGELAALARDWGKWLTFVTTLPVVYFDERYTSVEAEIILQDSGLNRRKRKAMRDKLAAQILLQNYLDSGCPEDLSPVLPLRDAEDSES